MSALLRGVVELGECRQEAPELFCKPSNGDAEISKKENRREHLSAVFLQSILKSRTFTPSPSSFLMCEGETQNLKKR